LPSREASNVRKADGEPDLNVGALARFPQHGSKPARDGYGVRHTTAAPSFSPYQLLELLGLLYSIVSVQDIGRIVMIIGIILAIGGALLWRFPGWFGWLGRLPGDISVQKGNFSFYFPLVTCILISVILTLLSWLFRR
jgi:Protein of unknown function (DUF2905)